MAIIDLQSSAESGPMLLLVEDSPDDAYFFRRQLAKLNTGFALKHVSDGKAAVDLIGEACSRKERLPDIVFLDLKMPVMNGFEVLEWIQQQPCCHKLKVTILSGSDLGGDLDRAKKLGAAGYLVKPISSKDLDQVLQTLLKECPHN